MSDEKQDEIKKRSLFHKIVNSFLYFLLGVFILLVIVVGFSQTSTFRNYLRETIVQIVNENINGTISLDRIDGTIFTSLILRNPVLTDKVDTIAHIQKIEIKISPLQLLLKRIHIRKISVENADILFLKDSTGTLNISKVFPPGDEDTTSSDFPFTIKIADLELSGINFKMLTYQNRNSTAFYDRLNFDDLRINDLRLKLNAYMSISDSEYELELEEIDFKPNFTFIPDFDFSGSFVLNKDLIKAENVKLKVKETSITLSAEAKKLNIFDAINSESLKKSYVKIGAAADNFDFGILSTFIPATDLLKGGITANMSVEGTLDLLNIKELNIKYQNTLLNATGKLLHLNEPEKLFIDALITNSTLNYNDVNLLLPSLDLPKFKGLEKVTIDSLYYYGEPLNFRGSLVANINNGNIRGDVALDLRTKVMKYEANIFTQNINLFPVFDIPLLLNSSSTIKGQGTHADNLSAEYSIDASKSIYDQLPFNNLKISGKVDNRFFFVESEVIIDSQNITVLGNLNFEDSDKPVYRVNVALKQFNLASLLKDTIYESSFNANIFVRGESFDPEKIIGQAEAEIFKSKYSGKNIEQMRMGIKLETGEDDFKKIDFASNIFDGSIQGKFKYDELFSALSNETEKITGLIINKINDYYPLDQELVASYTEQNNGVSAITNKRASKEIDLPDPNFNLTYSFKFKNLRLISPFFDKVDIETESDLNGAIYCDNSGFGFKMQVNAEYFKYLNKDVPYFFSNAVLNFSVNHPGKKYSFENLQLISSLDVDRLFIASEITKIRTSVKLKNSLVTLDGGAVISPLMKPAITGVIDLSGDEVNLSISKLLVNYGDFSLVNRKPIKIIYKDNEIDFVDFLMERGNSQFEIKGKINPTANQNLNISMRKFQGYDMGYSILKISPKDVIDGEFNLLASIKGTFDKPEISVSFSGDSISYKGKNFGSLKSNFSYDEKTLLSNIRFVEKIGGNEQERLLINGTLPIDLSFHPVLERLPSDKQVALSIFSDNFNLATFGDALPFIDRMGGTITTDIKIFGNYENLQREGSLKILNGSFLVEANNLEYNAGLSIRLEDKYLYVDSLLVKNMGNQKNMGTLRGSGKVDFDGLAISNMQFLLNGDLTVLADESKSKSPAVYGTLFVGTEGDIIFVSNKDRSFLSAPIVIKEADLYFPPTQSGYSGNANSFIYRFVEENTELSLREQEIKRLIAVSANNNELNENEEKKLFNFDYNIRVNIRNQSRITFILAREANTRLVAQLSGNLRYESKQGIQNVQGELKLLEGSTLEFFKTFSAKGTLRFESTLSNPYLDIVSTYKSFLADTATVSTGREQEVAVKIKLKGALQDLSKSFTQMDDNIAVYYGSTAIANDEPSTQYDKSDAVWFIITNKFKNEATPSDRTLVDETTTSLAGSILGGVLNAYLGDYVRTVEIRAVGSATKINLTGKFKDFRYTIGGTTNILQDFSTANIRIEYPLIQNLIVRVERKESLTETGTQNSMINELGIRYRFEF